MVTAANFVCASVYVPIIKKLFLFNLGNCIDITVNKFRQKINALCLNRNVDRVADTFYYLFCLQKV